MGIPKFFGYLRKSGYRGVFQPGLPSFVSNLLIDANGIIHSAAQTVYAYGAAEDPIRKERVKKMEPMALELELYQVVGNLILKLVNQIQPRETLVIAVDGIAPAAKINQQRQRRYRAAGERGVDAIFDSNSITPGTDFMIRLDRFLVQWIMDNADLLPPTIIYSSYQVPGEGEHKIMDMIRANQVGGGGASVISGLDADLFILALLSPLEHVYLFRGDSGVETAQIINVGNFRMGVVEKYGGFKAIDNFAILMSLLGNDFLPHQPMFDDMGDAIDLMLELSSDLTLVENNRINVLDFHQFIHRLARKEPMALAEKSIRDVKYPSRMFQIALDTKIPPTFNYQIFRSAWYANTFGTPDVKVDWIEDMAQDYVTGIEWIYRYYKLGQSAVSSRFVYPYFHTPLFTDLDVLHLSPELTPSEATPLRMESQLLAVLPPASHGLLSPAVQSLVPGLGYLFPLGFKIERDGFNQDWQGIVLVPAVDIEELQAAVNTLPLNPQFDQGTNLVITRNPQLTEILDSGRQFRTKVSQIMKQKRGTGLKAPAISWRDQSLLQ